MAKEKSKKEKLEREYIIPLRKKLSVVPRYKKTPKAVKTIKEFLVRHMQIRDRDLNKIKLDKYLNEVLWLRGIKNPPSKIKVKAIKEGDIVRVEAVDLPVNLKFKKLREEKLEKKSKEAAEKKKTLIEKAKESLKPSEKEEKKEKTEKSEEEIKEEKEKEKSVEEAEQEQEKVKAKEKKHTTKEKSPKEKKDMKKIYNKFSRGR